MTDRPTPIGESTLVWLGACALADARHPHQRTPTIADVEDARIVLLACTAPDVKRTPTHG